MIFITTDFLPNVTQLDIEQCRVYGTTCDDKHFIEIIDKNKDLLESEFVFTNNLYVLMENKYIEGTHNFYASISLHAKTIDNKVSYYPCVVTCESTCCNETNLKLLFSRVIEHLLNDGSYFSFNKEYNDNIKIDRNEEYIITELLSRCDINK